MKRIENEKVNNYIHILKEKSARLEQLTEDLVEASKISSGNIVLEMVRINLVELVYQTAGEFNEKFEQRNLTIFTKCQKNRLLSWQTADGSGACWKTFITMSQNMHWRARVSMWNWTKKKTKPYFLLKIFPQNHSISHRMS